MTWASEKAVFSLSFHKGSLSEENFHPFDLILFLKHMSSSSHYCLSVNSASNMLHSSFFCGAGEPFSDFNSSWETFIICTWKESRDGIVLSIYWIKRQFICFYIGETWNVLAFVHIEDYSRSNTHTVVHTPSPASSSSPFPETQDIHWFIRIP